MADTFDWNVILRLALQGAREVRGDLEKVDATLSHLNKTGQITDKQFEQLSKTSAAMSRSQVQALTKTEKAFVRQEQTYTKYLEKQESGAARQDRIYNDYLTHQTNAQQRALATQTREQEKASREAVAGIDRMSAATDKRIRQESLLSRESRKRDNRGAAAAWDEEFKALTRVSSAREQYLNQANSIRYANYDVATTMFTVSAAITAAGVATTVAAAQQERAFADVRRTAEGSLDGVQQALTNMSTEIPVAFTELSKIATLGNQLGVPAQKVEEFTRVVSAFSTVTGITAEASAQAFGRIGNIMDVPVDQFGNLASAITYTGRTSAATEQQIISLTERLGATATRAGFTAAEVVGLSGAVASLGIAPERAQGVFETYFNSLNESIAEGGDRLQNFATITGLTTDALSNMVRSGRGVEVFERFISNISGMSGDTVAVTSAMESLGLTGLRVNEVLPRLAGNMDLFRSSLQNSTGAWQQNNELQAQMAIILDTLSSKWQIFLNALMNAAAAIGSSTAPALKNLLDIATDVIVAFSGFVQSPFGAFLIRMGTSIGIVVAAYAALRGGIALATASALAFQTATRFLGGAGLIKGVLGLAQAMGIYGGAAGGAAGRTIVLRNAIFALGRITIIGGILMGITELVFNTGEAVQWLGQRLVDLGNLLGGLSFGIAGLERGASQIRDFGQSWVDWGKKQKTANDETATGADVLGDFEAALGGAGGGLDDFGGGLDDTAAKVRTLVDYANDLKSVWDRAFDIRFSGQTTLDAITSSFNDIRKAAADAAANIRTLKADIGGLQSDIKIQEYFLGIAIEYGDTARAEAIQANIAKLQADLAKKTEDLTAEQEKNSRVLTGNSAAALTNRGTLQSLVQQYQAHIGALASSGMSQEELARQTALLQQDFVNQATQLGYNTQDLGIYSAAFHDVKVAIDNVPRDVTVDANMDPALQALAEFAAKAAEAGRAAGQAFGSAFDDYAAEKVRTKGGFAKAVADQGRSAWRDGGGGSWGRGAGGGGGGGGGGGFAGGGYTGPGPRNQPAGIVHKGEYVVKKAWVDQRTGLPKADALGRLQRGSAGRTGYAGGGYVSGGGGGLGGRIEAFGPMAHQQLMTALRQIITVDGKVLADSNSRHYAADTAIGAR